jgi:hypothetical protein
MRDFFQISSVCTTGSTSAFRFLSKLPTDPLSSSDSKVRSITCVFDNPFTRDRSRRDGDNSRLTSPSSSSSESKTRTFPEFCFTSWVELLRTRSERPLESTWSFGFGVGLVVGGAGLSVSLQFGEAYLSSDVCHSPFASTMTSSTVSGVLSSIELKYLSAYQ